MRRGRINAPGGYVLDCMDCDERVTFTEAEHKCASTQLWDKGWMYFRGWFCPECAKENGLTNEKIEAGP